MDTIVTEEKAVAQIQKLTDLVKRIREQKHREATALGSARRAGKEIQERGEFIPKRITRTVRRGGIIPDP